MEYIIVGYPHGNGRYIEVGKISAESKEEALSKVHKSIWYEYRVREFNQQVYEELKKGYYFEIKTI